MCKRNDPLLLVRAIPTDVRPVLHKKYKKADFNYEKGQWIGC